MREGKGVSERWTEDGRNERDGGEKDREERVQWSGIPIWCSFCSTCTCFGDSHHCKIYSF